MWLNTWPIEHEIPVIVSSSYLCIKWYIRAQFNDVLSCIIVIDSRCLSAWPTGFSVLAQHNDSTISQQCHASDICVGSTPVDAVFLWVVFFFLRWKSASRLWDDGGLSLGFVWFSPNSQCWPNPCIASKLGCWTVLEPLTRFISGACRPRHILAKYLTFHRFAKAIPLWIWEDVWLGGAAGFTSRLVRREM